MTARSLTAHTLLALTLLSMSVNLYSESLGVFVPGIESAAKVADILKSDAALKGVDIDVFSKYKDFALALKSKDFTFIVSSSYFIDYEKDYEPVYQFTRDGKDTMNFRVIALEGKWTKANLPSTTIAVVETLDRDDTKDFLGKVLANSKFKRIKNISKAEDIYPILAMGNADVAFVSPVTLDKIKETFATTPKEVVKSDEVKFFIVGKKKNTAKIPAFDHLSTNSLKAIGASGITKYASTKNTRGKLL